MSKQFLFMALASGAAEPSTGVVVATGLTLVFTVLILLYLIISFQGKIFQSIDKRKNGQSAKAAPAPVEKAAPAVAMAKPVMQIEAGIPGEIVAAIAAAVASMDGGKYVMRSVKRAPRGRNAWSQAGVMSYTEPF